MPRLFACLLLLLFPTPVVAPVLRLCGYRIGKNVRVGFSLIGSSRIALEDGVRIGHLNLLRPRSLVMHVGSRIGRSNLVSGPLALRLDADAALGNRNRVTRGTSPAVVGWGATLRVGHGAKLTSDHQIDCTRSVTIGAHSILAGSGTQVWTHGYVHAEHGPARYRIDGKVDVGHNVYIGSRCIINLGVNVAPACIVGAGTVVSKSIDEPGLYVGAGMRRLPRPGAPSSRADLHREASADLCEVVYLKRR